MCDCDCNVMSNEYLDGMSFELDNLKEEFLFIMQVGGAAMIENIPDNADVWKKSTVSKVELLARWKKLQEELKC